MKKYLLSIAVLMAATISFTSCDDDDCPTCTPPVTIVQNGVYVINEGSYYSKINGTLDFLGYDVANDTYSMTRNIFEDVNGRSLGGTPNDALIVGDSVLCIAVFDENRIEFVNTITKKASTAIKIEKPRELAYESGSNYLYVSSFTGKVYKIDMTTRTITGESAVVGANLEGIAVAGNKLYVCNSCSSDYMTYYKNVVELNASTLAKNQDIEVVDDPVDVINAGSAIFILSMGIYADKDKPATVQMLKDGQISTIGNATMMAYGFIISAFIFDWRKRRPFRKAAEKRMQKMSDKRVYEFLAEENAKLVAAAKEKGLLRSEGKEYVVKDGDMIYFRFNV